jgi:hypothetical protein
VVASGDGPGRIAFDKLANLVNGGFNMIALVVVAYGVAMFIADAVRLGQRRVMASNEVVQPTRSR